MATYKTPDVYVEEISLFPPSVAEVATAIPAFIGYTKRAEKLKADDLRSIPTRIASMAEYEEYFGGADEESFTVDILEDTGLGTFKITDITREASGTLYRMYYSLKMFFANGGGPCYIVSVGGYSDTPAKGNDSSGMLGGLARIGKEDEPTILVFPDAVSLVEDDFYEVMNAALLQCTTLQDRFAVIDVHGGNVSTLRSKISGDLDQIKYGAVYHPWIETSLNYYCTDSNITIGTHTAVSGGETNGLAGKSISADDIKKNKNVLFNQIKAEMNKQRVTLPPGSAIAGVYARVDAARGVWKAPANVSLYNVIKPTVRITSQDQESLNVDPVAGKSVNAIRAFTGKGVLVWGARTLAGNDNEWRYVPVRRFFNMVEESIKKSTYWAVFEPNDANTWIKVKSMIENYLIQKWRDGALAGAKPDDAFYVKVGLGITMTALDILEGRMNVEIGMAVVRPAEFIILKFSHKMQTS
ncbi:MAG TPA: phage tail sheath C-terminal domain-containing protein [Dissulfurispiraceae bacterium]|nr:phage tail sheath C-terminal domain-containing protein [Dissulfurispiraceae bacterium]